MKTYKKVNHEAEAEAERSELRRINENEVRRRSRYGNYKIPELSQLKIYPPRVRQMAFT